MAELESSLKKVSKKYGETNKQLIARWGVGVARGVAVQTQVWGGGRGGRSGREAKKLQENAIFGDLLRICVPIKGARQTKSGKTVRGTTMNGRPISWPASRFYRSDSDLDDFWQMNRTKRRSRTVKLTHERKAAAPAAVFNRVLKRRQKLSGMAKGGWLQAGQMIAAKQKGTDRVKIGKNYLGYAQKHRGHGRIQMRDGDGFLPEAYLINTLPYTRDPHVLKSSKAHAEVIWSAKRLLTWYEKAVKKAFA